MKYNIKGDELVLSQVSEGYDALAATGLYRWNRRDKTMRAAVSVESINALENIFHRLPEPLQILRRTLQRRQHMLQAQREQLTGEPVPLVRYPVKAKLMRHQVVGANMALIQFGLMDEEDGHDSTL